MGKNEGHYEDPEAVRTHKRERELMRAAALGAVLQVARSERGWSVEDAAAKVDMGHMTLRRVETGYRVQSKTSRRIEELYGLPSGNLLRALGDDGELVSLARTLGVGIPRDLTPEQFVDLMAHGGAANRFRGGRGLRFGGTGHLTVGISVQQVTDAIACLASEVDPPPEVEDALDAMLRLLPLVRQRAKDAGIDPYPDQGKRDG